MTTNDCQNCGTPTTGPYCPMCNMMQNQAMARKIMRGTAIDLKNFRRNKQGEYLLDEFVEGADYCDSSREVWIWSIGVNAFGEIRAATDSRFYQSENWKCLFLR